MLRIAARRVAGITFGIVFGALAIAAETEVHVHALFPGKAMLSINGEQRVMRAGEVSADGVRLISADATQAVVEVDGRRVTLRPESPISSGFATPERIRVAVPRSAYSDYRVVGSINGRQVGFVIDTGADIIAISGSEARRLGIDYQRHGQPQRVQTAGGIEDAWRIQLDRVEVNGIIVRNVPASVLEGEFPQQALLGMSFLSRVSMREDSGVLYLEAH